MLKRYLYCQICEKNIGYGRQVEQWSILSDDDQLSLIPSDSILSAWLRLLPNHLCQRELTMTSQGLVEAG